MTQSTETVSYLEELQAETVGNLLCRSGCPIQKTPQQAMLHALMPDVLEKSLQIWEQKGYELLELERNGADFSWFESYLNDDENDWNDILQD